ncbi:DegT/DnrJ/EryC1/StrS family aminotransferase [Ancylomarina longa]|nr:DegT/DnrJ/EryC1/StrS family aminotransferase [Ancylomarina longa]
MRIKLEIDSAIENVIQSFEFVNGSHVDKFSKGLADFLKVKHVIPCGNGTDALQIAIMALQLFPGDEVIVPAYTYVATVEVISLLGLKPVFVDVDEHTFTLDIEDLKKKITPKTKLVIPVHLFGQCADMEKIRSIAQEFGFKIIEDTAQAIGAEYYFSNDSHSKAGTIGDFGTTSFFPSKNLACFGDGGALFTNDDTLAERAKMIANHGQKQKYHHEIVGCNSRLDSIQAAILSVKLKYLNDYTKARQWGAGFYDELLNNLSGVRLPIRASYSSHVFNQYTITIDDMVGVNKESFRDHLRRELRKLGVPSMVYYPRPLHLQEAYFSSDFPKNSLPVSEYLSKSVLSIPIHTEMSRESMITITKAFYVAFETSLSAFQKKLHYSQ